MPLQKWSDTIWVLTLNDEPAFTEDVIAARDEAQQAVPVPNIVIDLSGVSHLNSSNLSHLLRIRKLMVDNDRRMKLSGIHDSVWAIFLTTGLDKVFDFAGDVSTALAGLQLER